MDSCKTKKTIEWNSDDLEKSLKSMKNNKARDAHGHVYEIFKFGGDDLKDSLLKMLNNIKKKQIYPDIFKPSNITSLYKRKGEKSDLNNDRGVFNVVKIRSILDRMVYNDKYSIVDKSMSSSNIGGRKKRNIRDHLFVINSILHDFKLNSKENIDIEIYDVKKCFDKMWSSETANDFYDAGVKDDNFVLISNSNQSCQIAVKTPWGSLTPRVELKDIEMQGGVLTPLKCSVQIDTLGSEFLNNVEKSKILYKYKDCVSIPPLAFIDDVLTVTKCSVNSLKMNGIVQSKMECKKLELSEKKCFKMHLGKDTINCPILKVNSKEMSTTSSEKYLGDILTSNAKIDDNVKMRYDKGMGIINQVISILKEISFGIYHFEIGMQLRTAMLINGILFNTEALFNLTNKHTEMLEECDKVLMRRMFEAEQGTPVESFFLETSAWPIRFIIMGRKLMYYWTILRKGYNDLVKQVFDVQSSFPTKGDWISGVKDILEKCDIGYSEEEIKSMSMLKFKRVVKEKIQLKVMAHLIALQNKHSKSENLHLDGEMQPYLTSPNLTLTDKKFLFKMRSKMLRIKSNFSSIYKNDLSCSICLDKQTEENEIHLLCCPIVKQDQEIENEIQNVKYEDAFSNISKQKRAVRVFRRIMEIIEKQKK